MKRKDSMQVRGAKGLWTCDIKRIGRPTDLGYVPYISIWSRDLEGRDQLIGTIENRHSLKKLKRLVEEALGER